jgi:hypothetical protein
MISLNSCRRFGVELEINSFDKRNFKTNPLGIGELPYGIYNVGNLVAECFPGAKTIIKTWHPVHNNDYWIVKPDSSCGMELCTPLIKGNFGYNTVYKIVSKIKEKYSDYVDERCSFHIHVDVSDLTELQLSSVLAYWIKCEAVFMDAMPESRKKSRYCMPIGTLDVIQHDTMIEPQLLIRRLGLQKYYSLNTYHYSKDNRKSIEFRIADYTYCINPISARNWIKLIIHFVECASQISIPHPYVAGDQWSSYLWLNPKEVFQILQFDQPLSDELEEIKKWFVQKAKDNISNSSDGIWSETARKISQEQFLSLF